MTRKEIEDQNLHLLMVMTTVFKWSPLIIDTYKTMVEALPPNSPESLSLGGVNISRLCWQQGKNQPTFARHLQRLVRYGFLQKEGKHYTIVSPSIPEKTYLSSLSLSDITDVIALYHEVNKDYYLPKSTITQDL